MNSRPTYQALRKRVIRYFLKVFTLPRVKAEVASLAKKFISESSRYTKGVTGEARETKEAFGILLKYMKREKLSHAEKRAFRLQMIDLLKGTGVVVPFILIPIPFVGTLLLVIMDHLLKSMNIQLLPSAFYQQHQKELLTPEAVERDLEAAEE